MKFYCDACNTKYAIADDRIKGKVLKVRCKHCGNVVTVRENRAPQPASSAAREPVRPNGSQPPRASAPTVPTTNWYYALNGETFGPFTLDMLREKYVRAEVSDASYVWHEQLSEWKPVATVEAFADALKRGHQVRPRMNTLGFTGPIQAIGSEPATAVRGAPIPKVREPETPKPAAVAARSGPSRPEPTPQQRPSTPDRPAQPKPKPAREQASAARPQRPAASASPALPPQVRRASSEPKVAADTPAPAARPLADARQDKLERLRSRLGSTASTDETPAAKVLKKPAAVEQAPPKAEEEKLPQPVAGAAVLTFAPGARAEPRPAASPAELSSDAIDFNLTGPADEPDRPVAEPVVEKPAPASFSDILDIGTGPTEKIAPATGEADDSGVIPFIPSAPSLGGASSAAVQQPSESLLVEMSELQAEGRGKRVALIGVLIVVIVAIVAAGAYQFSQQPAEPEVAAVAVPDTQKPPPQRDELVVRRYSADQQAKIANTLDLEEEGLTEEAPVDENVAPSEAPEEVAVAVVQKEETAKPVVRKPQEKKAPRVQKAVEPKAEPVEEKAEEPEAPKTEAELLNSILKPRSSVAINRPTDTLREKASAKSGLSKDEARRGFKRVKESVRICRERHNRHNAQLQAQKIKVGIKVQPTGKVSDFTVEPKSVQNTEFDRCMKSHKERWRFASFQGDAVVINTSIVMQ